MSDTKIENLSPFKHGHIKNILVIKLDHIGDQILSLPAIRLLRQHFKDARIVGLIGEWSKVIAEYGEIFDEIITYNFFHENRGGHPENNGKREAELSEKLKRYKFDLAIDLRRQHQTRRFLMLSGARIKSGYTTDTKEDRLIDIALKSYADSYGIKTILNRTNSAIQALNLVKQVIGQFIPPDFLSLKIPSEEIEKSRQKLTGFGVDFSIRPIIGIHPGATHPAKQWGVERFKVLADSLLHDFGGQVVIFGAKEDEKIGNDIAANSLNKNLFTSAGKLSLKEFIASTANFDLIIGNDNGAMHCASAAGIPTITIFSGRETSVEWSPYHPRSLSIYRDIACSPCHLDNPSDCKYDFDCIRKIKPEEVVCAVKSLLKNAKIQDDCNYLFVKKYDIFQETPPAVLPAKKLSVSRIKRIITTYSIKDIIKKCVKKLKSAYSMW